MSMVMVVIPNMSHIRANEATKEATKTSEQKPQTPKDGNATPQNKTAFPAPKILKKAYKPLAPNPKRP